MINNRSHTANSPATGGGRDHRYGTTLVPCERGSRTPPCPRPPADARWRRGSAPARPPLRAGHRGSAARGSAARPGLPAHARGARRGRGPALPRGRRAVIDKFDGKWAPARGQAALPPPRGAPRPRRCPPPLPAEAGTALLTAASRDERQRLGAAPTSSVSPRTAVKRARPAAGEGNRNPPTKGRRDPKPGRRRGPPQPDSRREP